MASLLVYLEPWRHSALVSRAGAAAHPCDGVTPDTNVCDPYTGGESFFLCGANGEWYKFACPPGMVFSNDAQTCDGDTNVHCSAETAGPKPHEATSTEAAGLKPNVATSRADSAAGVSGTTPTVTTPSATAPFPTG